MFAVHCLEPRVQPRERIAMPRQHQQIVGQRLQLRDRIEPFTERIGIGLGHAERDIGADPRQHLVARDQHLADRIVQARMFGAVARSDDDLPVGRADPQRILILDAREAERHRRHDLPEPGPATRGGMRDLILIPPGRHAHRGHVVGHRIARIRHQHLRGQPLAARHHHRAAVLVVHPAGQADMIGVEMRTDHLGHAHARQRPLPQRLPRPSGICGVHAGVDQGDALALIVGVVEQPAIDVLERPGNMQPYPAHAGGHGHHLARGRFGPAERIGQTFMAGRDEGLVGRLRRC